MEARTTCRRSAIFKNIVAIIAAIVAVFMVGATGGYLVKTLSLPVAAPSAPVASGQSVTSVQRRTTEPGEAEPRVGRVLPVTRRQPAHRSENQGADRKSTRLNSSH